MPTTYDTIPAGELRAGLLVANLGIVRGDIQRNGVFVTATAAGTVWNLGVGRGDVVLTDHTWHQADEVVIERLS